MLAIEALGREVEFVAVNHWPVAVATHEKNHPGPNIRHYCKDLNTTSPEELVPEGYLNLLLASPECRFHSTAQGGRPLDEQNRATAWCVTKWAERLYIERIVVENVPRFVKWGPLDRKKRPIKKREGELFAAWVRTLEAIGYKVEWRVLNAADYGTPQTRKRLMIQARRDGRRIVWPEQTHAQRGREHTLKGALKTWTPARAAIDFDRYRHIAKSIFAKDLSPNTMARCEEGVKRFCSGPVVEAFLVMLRKHAGASSLGDPMPTVTTSGNHHVLIEPVLKPFVLGQHGGSVARDADEPLPTIATDGALHVLEPFIVPQHSAARVRNVDEPLPTVMTTSRGIGVIEPVVKAFIVESNHGNERPALSIDDPLPTITQKNGLGIIEPFVCANRTNNVPTSVDEPMATLTTAHGGGLMLIEPQIVEIDGQTYTLDLLHRMLQPEELGKGQDFEGYEFTGTREQQTMQIGNAVPIKLARAMTAAAFHDIKPVAKDEEVEAA
jgi:DNA (cytosine-5)-methyltransferase 1